MGRKILLGIFIFSLIISLATLVERYQVEKANRGIELIMDYRALQDLEAEAGEDLLSNYAVRGLTAVALYPDTLGDLINQGEIRLFTGNELERIQAQLGSLNPIFTAFPFTQNSAFVMVADEQLKQRFRENLLQWQEKYPLAYNFNNEDLLIFFPKWEAKYLHLSLGLDPTAVQRVRELDLKLIPRLGNNKLDNQPNWDLITDLQPEFIIFNGSEVSGYAQEEGAKQIRKTASLMLESGTSFGMIESYIAKQLGANELAYLLNFNLLRVHSIQQQEMDSQKYKYSLENIVNRYLRAVRERNVRLLYLKPFLLAKEGLKPAELTGLYIETLSRELRQAGYLPGQASPYDQFSSPNWQLILSSLGIVLAGVVLLEYLLGKDLSLLAWVFLLLAVLVQFFLLASGRVMLLRKVLALGSSVIFPSLAIISQLLSKRGEPVRRFIFTIAITLTGAVFLVSSLSHIAFVLNVDQFAGVKLSFLLPLFIVSIYYLMQTQSWESLQLREKVQRFLNLHLQVKHLLLLAVVALLALIYIGRSGNYPLLPVSELEVIFREWLEKVLYVRPRFKEFIFGHPFLILSLALLPRLQRSLLLYPLVILATIGQISISNTFSHIHTPLIISLIRVAHGIWLGAVLGWLAWKIIAFIFSRGLLKWPE